MVIKSKKNPIEQNSHPFNVQEEQFSGHSTHFYEIISEKKPVSQIAKHLPVLFEPTKNNPAIHSMQRELLEPEHY